MRSILLITVILLVTVGCDTGDDHDGDDDDGAGDVDTAAECDELIAECGVECDECTAGLDPFSPLYNDQVTACHMGRCLCVGSDCWPHWGMTCDHW